MPSIGERFKNSWNAFLGRSPTEKNIYNYTTSYRPDRYRLRYGNLKTLVGSVYNQIAVDVSQIDIRHVRLNSEGRYEETINDSLNEIFNLRANLDQNSRDFIRDIVLSLFDEGCIAIVPTDTDINPFYTDGFKVYTARVAKILQWSPYKIQVSVYNERIGQKEEIWVDKRFCPIIENPFYTTMNESSSVASRLIKVLAQLDHTNSENSSGKIDILFQLPYSLKGEIKKRQAEERRETIEKQLVGSKYGIAYIDSTEKVIQLNRSLENNLWEQAKELTTQLYNELGFSEAIFNGTADEVTMLNYRNRTLEPILSAITLEIESKWLSRTARSQNQAIRFFSDPFKLVPVAQIAEIADKFTRNEIMTSNEMRAVMGIKPSSDPKADKLINSNLNHPDEGNNKQKQSESIQEEEKIIKRR